MKAIIVGASSGMGAQLASELARDGYSLGLVARRRELLDSIAETLATSVLTRAIDVADVHHADQQLNSLIEEMGGVDLVVISSGVGHLNRNLDWEHEAETIAVNVTGFTCIVNVAVRHFTKRKAGHLVGISSVAGVRGHGSAPAYGASKAFETNYLQEIRHRFAKAQLTISVTIVQPGFVDTAMAQGEGLFWVAPVNIASRQILRAIRKRKPNIYVTRRWRAVSWILRLLPGALYQKV